MKNNNYAPPELKKESFHCPYCDTYAHQEWYGLLFKKWNGFTLDEVALKDEDHGDYQVSQCAKCDFFAIWNSQEKMIYPLKSSAPSPKQDMPDDVKEIYEEARKVQVYSPRAAAALLRVALEKLTEHLGEKKGKLNTRIKNLNAKGLPEQVIQSLDILRITANEGGSHAGQIDLTGQDSQEIVNGLFSLVNFIVAKIITESQKIDKMFNQLPKNKKEGIKNRDSQKNGDTI